MQIQQQMQQQQWRWQQPQMQLMQTPNQQCVKQKPEMAQQVMQQGAGAASVGQDAIEKILEEADDRAGVAFPKDNRAKAFMLDIETDCTIMADENAEKQRRTEFVQVLGALLPQLSQMITAEPKTAEFCGEILKFATAPFRAGRSLDGAIDELVEQMKAKGDAAARATTRRRRRARSQLQIEQMKQDDQRENDKANMQLKQTRDADARPAREAEDRSNEKIKLAELRVKQQDDESRAQLTNAKAMQAREKHQSDMIGKERTEPEHPEGATGAADGATAGVRHGAALAGPAGGAAVQADAGGWFPVKMGGLAAQDTYNPWERAAERMRRSVKGPRQEGLTTKALERLGQRATDVLRVPERAFQTADVYGKTGEYDPGPIVEAATLPMTGAMPFAARGAAGVFGGRLAQTANKEMLAKAEELAAKGAYPDYIWEQTGWFQGADKKWRFEITDKPSAWKTDPQNLYDRTVMRDVFHHPELYQAYPELGYTELKIGMAGPGNTKGSYMAGMGVDVPTITLDPRAPASMRSTNLHELQHAIQEIEDFARGGSSYSGLRPNTPAWDIYQERLKAIRTPKTEAELKAAGVLSQEYPYSTYLKEHQQALRNDKLGLDRIAQETAVREAYRRSAGEVEARAVQKRTELSPEYLRDVPPSYSWDVPQSEQIIQFRAPMGSLAAQDRYVIP